MTTLATTYWVMSLAIGVVVIAVAAVLLAQVLRTARQIDAGARAIWTEGKLVARNTVHIADLKQTNQVAADILEGAAGILMAAGRIHTHAVSCPGCPACLMQAQR